LSVTGAFWDNTDFLEADTSGSRTHAKERADKETQRVDRIRVIADLGRVRMHPGGGSDGYGLPIIRSSSVTKRFSSRLHDLDYGNARETYEM
jgi:hypothetical protein